MRFEINFDMKTLQSRGTKIYTNGINGSCYMTKMATMPTCIYHHGKNPSKIYFSGITNYFGPGYVAFGVLRFKEFTLSNISLEILQCHTFWIQIRPNIWHRMSADSKSQHLQVQNYTLHTVNMTFQLKKSIKLLSADNLCKQF